MIRPFALALLAMLSSLSISLLSNAPLRAQPPNLVTNGDFESDVAGWEVFGEFLGIPGGDPTAVSFVAGIDGLNQPGSGALRLSGQMEFTQLGQCIQLDPTVDRYTDGVAIRGDEGLLTQAD
ncbi:MAG: hypothetical protein AAFY88_00805 [Acidobacteriota bacterium]